MKVIFIKDVKDEEITNGIIKRIYCCWKRSAFP